MVDSFPLYLCGSESVLMQNDGSFFSLFLEVSGACQCQWSGPSWSYLCFFFLLFCLLITIEPFALFHHNVYDYVGVTMMVY